MKRLTSNAKTLRRKEYKERIKTICLSNSIQPMFTHTNKSFSFAPLRLCVGSFVLLLSTTAMAEDTLKGEGELGFTSTSGNTESQSLIAKLGITKTHDQWTHKANISVLQTSTNNVTSARSTSLEEKSQYNFTEASYGFGKLRYENDKFSGYDYRTSITLGVGSNLIKNETHSLDASVGIGYRSSKDTATQKIINEGIATADAAYEYKISQTATFSEKLSVESGKDNTHSESETALKTKINGNLSSKITYLIKHNSDVPVLVEKTDKILTVSLMYNF